MNWTNLRRQFAVICLAVIICGCSIATDIDSELAAEEIVIPVTGITPSELSIISPTPAHTVITVPTATLFSPTVVTEVQLVDYVIACIPEGNLIPEVNINNPRTIPGYAVLSTMENGIQVIGSPSSYCTFLFTFNNPPEKPVILQIFDLSSSPAQYVAELLPNPGYPNQLYVDVTHSYIINSPLWESQYRVVVETADASQVYMTFQLRVKMWQPEVCPDGSFPDPITLICPIIDG